MKWIRRRVLAGELLAGTFLNLGSSVTAEIAGKCGFDWVLVDLEHGSGDRQELLHQLQALESSPACPIVRVVWNDAPTAKRMLDLGAGGIMVPYVSTAEEARHAVACTQYPPAGIRGVASSPRACAYGQEFDTYFGEAADGVLAVVQIETGEGVKNAEEIASVDRLDVLFVGPLDLSVSLGRPRQFDHPEFRGAVSEVVSACRKAGKAAGILAATPALLERYVDDGFTFVACGSDGTVLAAALRDVARAFDRFR